MSSGRITGLAPAAIPHDYANTDDLRTQVGIRGATRRTCSITFSAAEPGQYRNGSSSPRLATPGGAGARAA